MEALNLSSLIKIVEIEHEGLKYICKIKILDEDLINISIYSDNKLKYRGNIFLEKIQSQIKAFFDYNITEVFEEIKQLNNNNFSIIKQNNKYKFKIKFIILRRKKYLYIDLNDNNNNNNNFKYENLIKEKDKIIFELNKKIKLLEEQLKNKKDNTKNNLDNNNFKALLITPIHNLSYSIYKRKNDAQPNKNNKVKEINREYNYELLNYDELSEPKVVDEEDDLVIFKIFVKNNKKLPWPEKKTKFILDNKSSIKTLKNKNIELNPLQFKQYQQLGIEFDLKNIDPGEYQCFLNFNVDGHNYGNILVLTIKIKEGKITDFRENYSLSKEDFTKGKLLESLKKIIMMKRKHL